MTTTLSTPSKGEQRPDTTAHLRYRRLSPFSESGRHPAITPMTAEATGSPVEQRGTPRGVVRGHVVAAVGVLRARLSRGPSTRWPPRFTCPALRSFACSLLRCHDGYEPDGLRASDAGGADGSAAGIHGPVGRRGCPRGRVEKSVSRQSVLPCRLRDFAYGVPATPALASCPLTRAALCHRLRSRPESICCSGPCRRLPWSLAVTCARRTAASAR